MAFKKILVPLDGSMLSELALTPAVDLGAGDASVVLLRAVEAHTFPGADPTDRQVEVVDDAEEYLARVERQLPRRGVKDVQTSVWYGPAVPAITEAAATRGVDLVVMSTHGRRKPAGEPLLPESGAAQPEERAQPARSSQ